MFDRIRRGWRLTKQSWGVIRTHPGLVRFPITGGLSAAVAGLLLVLPGLFLLSADQTSVKVVGGVLAALGVYLASCLVIYFNVALAAAADEALQGRTPDLKAARQVATNRIPVIAAWALVSVAVSLVLSVVRDKGGQAGHIVAGLGGAIWGLVTFLVIPVVALEGIGPIAAIQRSGRLFKQRWGEQVTGNIAIGGISGLISIVGIAVAAIGVVLVVNGSAAAGALGVALIVLGALVTIASMVFAGAARGVFGVALYHFVTEDRAIGPFSFADLESSARPR